MVVDGHVNELPPLLGGAERALASDPMAHSIEAAKPFDVNVKQLAGALTFVPANGRRRIRSCHSRVSRGSRRAASRGRHVRRLLQLRVSTLGGTMGMCE